MEGVEAVRFLPRAKQSSSQRKTHKNVCDQSGKDPQQEKVYWVPLEAFQFAHDFRFKFQGELTDQLIDDLLFEVSEVYVKSTWTSKSHVSCSSTRYGREEKKLKSTN